MKHHTKDKGDLGVLKAKADLCMKGFLVLSPESEHAPFDLVIYDNISFKRIQVKARSVLNNSIRLSFRSSWADKYGTHTKYVDKSQIDLYCIYCLDNDKCYYLDPRRFKKNVHLRFGSIKSRVYKNMHMADQFLNIPGHDHQQNHLFTTRPDDERPI